MHRLLPALLVFAATIRTLLADSSTYLVYQSHDQGRSWIRADGGLPTSFRINAFASSGGHLIAGTDGGIFISTNRAQTWQPASNTSASAVAALRVTSLATLPRETSHALFAGTSEGFLLSSLDHGTTWQTNQSFPRRNIRSLHALNSSIYVGTDSDHVYKSSDLGKTWTHLAAGLPPHSQVFALTSIKDQLFAGLYAQGLYTWNQSAQQWNRIGQSANIRPLALAANGNTLIAGHNPGGIFWSDDLGQNWKPWSLPSTAAAADSPEEEFADDAPFPSLKPILGSSRTATLPLLEQPVWEISADSKIALTGAGPGIYYSTDQARTWSRAATGLPADSAGIAFLIHDDLILAATHHKTLCGEVDPK